MASNAQRRAPAEGYDFQTKATYRSFVYTAFANHLGDSVPDAHVLMLPSKEAIEPTVAMAYGFKEANLHLVDDNPAIVARHFAHRFPLAHRYGARASEACERIAKSGLTLDALNLDLTAQISRSLLLELRAVAASGAVRAGTIIAVTILRGRDASVMESPYISHTGFSGPRELNQRVEHAGESDYALTETDEHRLRSALCVFDVYWPKPLETFSYRSVNGQTFLSLVFVLRDPAVYEEAKKRVDAAWNALADVDRKLRRALRSKQMRAWNALYIRHKRVRAEYNALVRDVDNGAMLAYYLADREDH